MNYGRGDKRHAGREPRRAEGGRTGACDRKGGLYTNDLAPSDSLIVKIVRSPHAHALIKDINTARAEAVPGIECVLTYKDCPDKRFTLAGQTYPGAEPVRPADPRPEDALCRGCRRHRGRHVGRGGQERP